MTTIVILQSNYLPWKGYFDLIHDADAFVFYDDVQFTKNDWRNRNKIKTQAGPSWITIPVGGATGRRICDVEIEDRTWAKKHWKTIQQYYSKAPHFNDYADLFREVYTSQDWRNLSALNQYVIRRISEDVLGLRTEFHDSRDFAAVGDSSERLIAIVQRLGGTRYLSGPAAAAYLDVGRFEAAGIEVAYKDYTGYPEYPQFHPPFEHAVSIVDLLFHTGPLAAEFIWGWRESPVQRSASPSNRLR